MPISLNHSTVFATLRAHASALERLTETDPVRILVVDDNDSVLTYLDRVLRNAGYHTTLATNGAEGLHAAMTAGAFDLLLTDLRMPCMMGEELARRVRAVQSGVKVLFLTGYSGQLFDDRITLHEDEAFLEKPCSVASLLEAVSQLLWRHTKPEAALRARPH